ncbi:MAG TPA: hypothetical protein VFZ17_13265 [Acidimicrobiia bacterium]|nr:hypothetical protein [Acidimicrobiia bacterium]
MPPEPRLEHHDHARAMSRRELLRAGGVAGLAVAATALLGADALPAFAAGAGQTAAIPFSSDLYASPLPQRFSLILQRGTSDGIKYVSGPPVKVRFKPPGGAWQPYTKLRLDTEGLPKGRGVYRTDLVFDQPGNWKGQAAFGGSATGFTMSLPQTAVAPVPGQAAPRAASPTTADALGVNPICTRTPACPLHTVSLSDVIGAGKPVAVMFATPALCQSAYCGPVLDELLAIMGPYADRVTFVHVDIYKSLTDTTLSPTVKAWNLPSEPWLYGIDGAGTITARLDTAFGKTEMVALLDGLVA